MQNVIHTYLNFCFAIILFSILFLLFVSHLDSVHIGEEVSWVKVNSDMTGYYVVHYEDGGWDEMARLLRQNHTALSYKDRTQLIHNAMQLVT